MEGLAQILCPSEILCCSLGGFHKRVFTVYAKTSCSFLETPVAPPSASKILLLGFHHQYGLYWSEPVQLHCPRMKLWLQGAVQYASQWGAFGTKATSHSQYGNLACCCGQFPCLGVRKA